MKIIADENIPCLQHCFANVAELITHPARHLTPADLQGAKALLVRSITQANEALLQNTTLQFIASATAGIDHIDQMALAQHGIQFAYAAGCNALAVMEYVLAAVNYFAQRDHFTISERTIGVVGCGQVGSRVRQAFELLGATVYVYDPFVAPLHTTDNNLVSFETLLRRCNIITLHTPLTQTGAYPTYHMISGAELEQLHEGSILINASRGAVVNNAALKNYLQTQPPLSVVLDVWEFEPQVDLALMALVDLATPHIAGYSLEGKVRGTIMIYEAFCRYFDCPIEHTLAELLPQNSTINNDSCPIIATEANIEQAISAVLRSIYDISRDDATMRQRLNHCDTATQAQQFDQLRKQYPIRRELGSLNLTHPSVLPFLQALY